MLESILQLDTMEKILFNTLFVSIPEEIYWVMFTLILVGEFDYWKDPECKKLFHRYDYGRILIPAISVALLSNIFRYTGFNSGLSSLITFIILYIAIVLTNDIFGDSSALKWMGKIFIFLILGIITIGITELLYVPLILYGTDLTMKTINNDMLLNFLISLPSRFIQYSLLLYLIVKKRTSLKGNIFKHIIARPTLLALTSLFVTLNLLFLWIMNKLIMFEKILIDFSYTMQMLIIIGIIIFPIINISTFVWSIYYIKNREVKNKRIIKERLQEILNKLDYHTYKEDWSNTKWKLNEIGMGIEEIATDLYTDYKK